MPGTCLYIVSDVQLATEIQRKSKDYSFKPFIKRAAQCLATTSKASMDSIHQDPKNPTDADVGIFADFHRRTQSFLTSATELEIMGQDMAKYIEDLLNQLDSCIRKNNQINLSAWMKYCITSASTTTMYGPQNPFLKIPGLDQAFSSVFLLLSGIVLTCDRDFEADIMSLLLDIFPSITARKGYKGQALLKQAFVEYFSGSGWSKGCALTRASHQQHQEKGVPISDQAGFELCTCIGLLTNSIPSAQWMLYHILSDRNLLTLILAELKAFQKTFVNKSPNKVPLFPATGLHLHCPLLVSTLKETLRIHSTSLTVRMVTRDAAILNNEFFLRRNSLIHIPATAMHRNTSIWDTDAAEFRANRFITTDEGNREDSIANPKPSAAYRAFGGGTTLCPGRHLAQIQVLSVVAGLLLRFDFETVEGKWFAEKPDYVGLVHSTQPGPTSMWCKISPREVLEM